MSPVRITQVRSAISRPKPQGKTLRALGLHRIGDSATYEESPEIMGMIRKVIHLIRVEKTKATN